MTSPRARVAILLAASLTLTGCSLVALPGTTVQSPAPTSTAAPATGDLVSGDGYSYHAPDGWTQQDPSLAGGQVDTLIVDLGDDDGFSDNLNVLLSPAGAVTADQVENLGVTELENAGATNVEVRPRLTIAGSESAHLTALAASPSYQIDQFYPTHDGQTYVVTFSFSDTVSQADREAIAESVLASWAWA